MVHGAASVSNNSCGSQYMALGQQEIKRGEKKGKELLTLCG